MMIWCVCFKPKKVKWYTLSVNGVDNNYELCNGISGECKIFDTIDQCIEYITRNGDVVA